MKLLLLLFLLPIIKTSTNMAFGSQNLTFFQAYIYIYIYIYPPRRNVMCNLDFQKCEYSHVWNLLDSYL
jgi:hypothetical protein